MKKKFAAMLLISFGLFPYESSAGFVSKCVWGRNSFEVAKQYAIEAAEEDCGRSKPVGFSWKLYNSLAEQCRPSNCDLDCVCNNYDTSCAESRYSCR